MRHSESTFKIYMDLPIDVNTFNCDNCLDGVPCGCLLLDRKVILHIENLVQKISSRGCFEVCSNCIDLAIISEAFAESISFFNKPLEEKLKTFSKDRAKRGYSPVETENFSSLLVTDKKVVDPNDNVEKYRVGPLRNPYGGDGHGESSQIVKDIRAHFYPNDWTNLSLSFRTAIECYYESMSQMTKKILKVLAFSLRLPADAFLHSVDRHTSILSLNRYPAVEYSPSSPESTTEGRCVTESAILPRLWMAEHTDVSMVSVITQYTPALLPSELNSEQLRGGGGLQVRHNAVANPGHDDESEEFAVWETYPRHSSCNFVVLVGSCMTAITKNLLPAARHRVAVSSPMPPSSSLSAQAPAVLPPPLSPSLSLSSSSWSTERYSLVFFFAPNVDSSMSVRREDGQAVPTYSQWRQDCVKAAMKSLKGKVMK